MTGVSAPEVTVVVTTRDRPHLVHRAVESALSQTLEYLEVICVDAGETYPYALAVADGRLRVIRPAAVSGICAARNRGMEAARGRWITFLDDDDLLVPDMLERSLAAAAASPLPKPVAVLSAIEVVDRDGRTLELRLPPTLSRGRHYFLEDAGDRSFQTQNTLVVTLELLREIGGWDEGLKASEHDDLFLRLNAACSIQGVDEVGYRLTAHAGTRLSRDLAARAEALERTVAKHEEVFAQHPRRYAEYLGATGTTNLRAGRWGRAVAASTRALALDPRRPRALRQWTASLAGPAAWSLIDAGRQRLASSKTVS